MSLDNKGAFWRVLLLLTLQLWPRVFAERYYQSTQDVFPGLAGLPLEPSGKIPGPGGMSWDICCRLAVNESLTVENGSLAFVPGQTVLHGNITNLMSFGFPCHRVYNGSTPDQPQVSITWDWCNKMCPGWSITSSDDLTEWAQPLVAFIMPAVVFCLSVPRRRRLTVPVWLFQKRYGMLAEGVSLLYRVPIASAIVTLDIILWIIVIISLSGPFLLSGLYEALLDVRIMRFLESRMQSNGLTIRQRAHLLLIVPLGNLDHDPAWDHSKRLIEELPDENRTQRLSKVTTTNSPGMTTTLARMAAPPDVPRTGNGIEANNPPTLRDNVNAGGQDPITQQQIDMIKIKLRSMIRLQSTFGESVGAAVVFYIGSVVFTLLERERRLGST